MTEYTPITKVKAAEILSVSPRTIDNMMADGTLPTHYYIGRKAYWHPDVFFSWLNLKLGCTPSPDLALEVQSVSLNTSTSGRRGRPRKSGR